MLFHSLGSFFIEFFGYFTWIQLWFMSCFFLIFSLIFYLSRQKFFTFMFPIRMIRIRFFMSKNFIFLVALRVFLSFYQLLILFTFGENEGWFLRKLWNRWLFLDLFFDLLMKKLSNLFRDADHTFDWIDFLFVIIGAHRFQNFIIERRLDL